MCSDTVYSQPSLFVGHGAPDLVLSDIPARRFLRETGRRLPKPRAIVVISAHWLAAELQMTGPGALETIHDYAGWPAELYDIEYRASGADWLNERLAGALDKAGYTVRGIGISNTPSAESARPAGTRDSSTT